MGFDKRNTAASLPGGMFWLCLILIGLLSLGVRAYYVVHAQVLQPVNEENVRGDAVEYYHYAWNLTHHATFSKSPPSESAPIADSFRDPGYPTMLAIGMHLLPDWDSFYAAILLTQALLGSLTVVFLLLSARRYLSTAWLTCAGLLMALWPHSVAIPSFLLSETLFGFLVALALWLASEAVRHRAAWLALTAGLAFSVAAMTNAVLLPFAALATILLGLHRVMSWRMAVMLALASLVLPMAWGARSLTLADGDSSSGRAELNFVQGSWPLYHNAYQTSIRGDPAGLQTMAAIDAEYHTMQANKLMGIKAILVRMNSAPWHYVAWYLYKPALLWSWDVRIGQGEIYVYPTRYSPFKENIFFIGVISIAHALNIPIFALAACGCLLALREEKNREQQVLALIAMFATAIYTVLQSEPRYAIALRGEELLLAALAAQAAARTVQGLRQKASDRMPPSLDGTNPAGPR